MLQYGLLKTYHTMTKIAYNSNGYTVLGAVGLVSLASDRRCSAAQTARNKRVVRFAGVYTAM